MGDAILFGVLRMPPAIWGNDEMDKIQRYARYLEAADEIDRLRAEVERLTVDGIHSCHDQCPRIACVQRREIERLRAALTYLLENCSDDLGPLALDTVHDALTGPSPGTVPVAQSKSQQKRFDALRRLDLKRFQSAPCYVCGYNGPDYYQSEVHECAGLYHEQTNELP